MFYLGCHGILSSHMPKVSGDEANHLKIASYIIRDLINLGETFVTGEIKPPANLEQKLKDCVEKQEQVTNQNLSIIKEKKPVQRHV